MSYASIIWAYDVLLPSSSSAYVVIKNEKNINAWQISTQTPHKGNEPIQIGGLKTPLGSVWKLFVYDYIVENELTPTDYQCSGQNLDQEKYCCNKGESIDLDQALLKSCGLYFDPERLGITQHNWKNYWQQKNAPDWLYDIKNLNENNLVPVVNLLDGLLSFSEHAKEQSSTVLSNLWLKEANESSLAYLGTSIRAKTYTMPHPIFPSERIGGFAGWLPDGKAIWLIGRGNSMSVLEKSGFWLKEIVERNVNMQKESTCVEVNYFAFSKNPIKKITDSTGQEIYSGQLPKGVYSIYFTRGNPSTIESDNDVTLSPLANNRYKLIAKMGLNEYVARVLDREVSNKPEQAAKAFSVAIRTYVLQESSGSQNCLLINDSTLQQRVSPRPSSQKSKQIAVQTDKLILEGLPIQYRLSTDKDNQLSWVRAVSEDKQGLNFKNILTRAYPKNTLNITHSQLFAGCPTLPTADAWLETQQQKWRAQLRTQPGFKSLNQLPSICQLTRGTPYADIPANRIYIRQFKTYNDQISLAHEYLHLTFANHPNGENEFYIEQLAKKMVLGKNYD